MADINEELLRLLDGPGPQYINPDNKPEWNRGSDGAQHMKIVDQNGNPISTQNVRDADVKTELESVKAELQSLKEHTFNTQLTGSNVELRGQKSIEDYVFNAETVQPGERVAGLFSSILDDDDLSCSIVYVGVFTDSSDWSLEGRRYSSNSVTTLAFTPVMSNQGSHSSSSETQWSIMHRNNDQIDSMDEAIRRIMPYDTGSSPYIRFANNSENAATVTMRILRIWRSI